MRRTLLPALVAAAALAACGGGGSSSSSTTPPPVFNVFISAGTGGATVSSLVAPSGAPVNFVNNDGATSHQIASEASPGAFAHDTASPGAFDTGPFTGTKTVRLAAGLPDGTRISFFCVSHPVPREEGAITISAAAAGGGGY